MSVPYSSSHVATDPFNNISEEKKKDIYNSIEVFF